MPVFKKEFLAFRYTGAQLFAKGIIAISQIYAILVFSRILLPNDAAIIFILLGYSIWIQIFEFGISQVIQNALNLRKISISGICRIICFHYFLMIFFATLVVLFPNFLYIFLGNQISSKNELNHIAFSLGIALLLINTNNILLQKLLLVSNHELLGSLLVIFQSLLSIILLSCLQFFKVNLIESVVIYFSVPALVFGPLTLKILKKAIFKCKKINLNWEWLIRNTISFWGLSALSSIYLGLDYFFVARSLLDSEISSYHFASRLFFISYIAYISYIHYAIKNISSNFYIENKNEVSRVSKIAIITGFIAVNLILIIVILIWRLEGFSIIGINHIIAIPIIVSAGFYYSIRVIRDVGLVIVWNLGHKRMLFFIHTLEVILAVLLLNLFANKYNGVGIFLSMGFVSIISSYLIFIYLRKIKIKYFYN